MSKILEIKKTIDLLVDLLEKTDKPAGVPLEKWIELQARAKKNRAVFHKMITQESGVPTDHVLTQEGEPFPRYPGSRILKSLVDHPDKNHVLLVFNSQDKRRALDHIKTHIGLIAPGLIVKATPSYIQTAKGGRLDILTTQNNSFLEKLMCREYFACEITEHIFPEYADQLASLHIKNFHHR